MNYKGFSQNIIVAIIPAIEYSIKIESLCWC